ncbi:MAG: hypothetical protein HBSAPP03_01850 [Phycisphaerae bacterium]|nr:MAG: hypothetical protein HBSAPP03_01850 [Phycisphaerae bacterium]
MRVAMTVAAFAAMAGVANAAVVYTNTTQTGSRYQPGADIGGTPNIVIDDVPFPVGMTGGATHVEITKMTIALRRQGASSPAQTVNFYTTTFTATAINAPSLLGSINIPVGTGTAFFTDIHSIGDGSTVMATVPLDYALIAGFGTIGAGISFSDTAATATTGWRVTSGPDANANAGWLWLPDQASQFGPFTFSGTGAPSVTFYIVIEGNFVPAPGSLALVGLGGLVALRRRR